jgi:AcrR family transcriptional regulator
VTRKRLTRKEKQADTRSRLLRSAAKVFCRKGMDRGSVEEVAGDAGFTKGASYANFKSKEELFLAMLDERFGERLDEIDRISEAGGPLESQVREAGEDFARGLGADPVWQRLFFEFTAYAARNDDFAKSWSPATGRCAIESPLCTRGGRSVPGSSPCCPSTTSR